MKRTLGVVFCVTFAALLVFFASGWYSLSLGPANPIPWPIQSVWGTMISVGQGFEALIGYVPHTGRDPLHQVAVIGSATLAWALAVTTVAAGFLALRRLLRRG
jgi:hypothetical protein